MRYRSGAEYLYGVESEYTGAHMMTPEDNELLTRVEPGTKMGELLRRYYWHPIAASDEMMPRPTKAVRILGESLVLFRDALGNFGLIGDRCPHRRASLL